MEKEHFGRPIPQSVAIVAMGQSRIDYGTNSSWLGNYREVADEIWVVNRMAAYIYNDILFRMDDLSEERDDVPEPFKKTMREHPLLVTSKAYPEYPGSVDYPLEEVVQSIGVPYLNTTPAYALAYAIHLGVKQIHVYGCDYTYPNQARAEKGRGCFEWLMGFAFAKGIELMMGPNTSLMDTCIPPGEKFYGYKDFVRADVIDGEWKILIDPTQQNAASFEKGVGQEVLNDN